MILHVSTTRITMTAGITHRKTFKTKGDIKTEFNEIVQTNLKLTKERRELKDDLKEVQKECELLKNELRLLKFDVDDEPLERAAALADAHKDDYLLQLLKNPPVHSNLVTWSDGMEYRITCSEC